MAYHPSKYCPRCGAPSASPCVGSRGRELRTIHKERYMHQYRWTSKDNSGPFYNPNDGMHYASAHSIDDLANMQDGPTDLQTIQVYTGSGWSWAEMTPLHLGGYDKGRFT